MKHLYAIVILFLTNTCCFAQSQDEVIELITQAAASIKCINCQFIQQKTMAMLKEPAVSRGIISYKSPDKIRWEYTTPYSFALVVDGEKIVRITDSIEDVLDMKTARMYQGFVNSIMDITKGKNVFDKSMFDIDINNTNWLWIVKVQPKKHNMKRIFTTLTVDYRKTDKIINRIEITQACGVTTTIHFFDVKINELCD